VIPADLGAELARAIAAVIAAGDLPPSAMTRSASGTWRRSPARARPGGNPGTYATSLPLGLARLAGAEPRPLAARLAGELRAPWIDAARVTGTGYLTITVSPRYLAGLPARVLAAGPAVARSDALAGTRLASPGLPDLATVPTWERAWRLQHEALVGRLAEAAGGEVMFADTERKPSTAPTTRGGSGPVSAALAYFGVDALRYALARVAKQDANAIERQLAARLDLANPFFAVRYAQADAASVLRWAGELGLAMPGQVAPAPGQDGDPPALTVAAPELRLLDAMSWLPERVAAAARRRRPAELTAYLESVAELWLACRERCPALPFCGVGAPVPPTSQHALARLMLADATRATLAAGLGVLCVSAPARI
jgi:arginyl-tRNA synthetase